jgi:hypothetical protein
VIHARSRASLLIAAAALAACALLSASALGEDAAPPAHKPVQKIEQPFLVGLVGTWNVSALGVNGEASGVSRVRLATGGTAIVQESRILQGDRVLRTVSVLRAEEGGKALKQWRFDTLGHGDVREYHGTASSDGVELTGADGVAIRIKKNEHDSKSPSKSRDSFSRRPCTRRRPGTRTLMCRTRRKTACARR